MAQNTKQATILTPHAVKGVRKTLSSSWKNAAGMLRHHKRGLDRYISRVRKEWK